MSHDVNWKSIMLLWEISHQHHHFDNLYPLLLLLQMTGPLQAAECKKLLANINDQKWSWYQPASLAIFVQWRLPGYPPVCLKCEKSNDLHLVVVVVLPLNYWPLIRGSGGWTDQIWLFGVPFQGPLNNMGLGWTHSQPEAHSYSFR